MSLFSFMHFFRKEPVIKNVLMNGLQVKTFKKKDILAVLDSCPNGSIIMINERTRVHVYHPEGE